jgi:poly(3-hydroxybutyrate) depolymerase
MGFLWPAIAAETASELALATARGFVGLAMGIKAEATKAPPPQWTTSNRVLLEMAAVRLRDFSTSTAGPTTLICAPFALHGATIVDFAPLHSLVRALQDGGINRLCVTDWQPATAQMRYWCIDDYLAALNVLVDELGGAVSLVGLCQGGWMALMYAARFPRKVRKLVLAAAPIDVGAGTSKLTEVVNNTPSIVFKELVKLGEGRVLGHHLLKFWAPPFEMDEVHRVLQPEVRIDSSAFLELNSRFLEWYAWTLDLPGAYYVQVVEQLFKENRLARSEFVALGRRLDLSDVRCPVFLLAAKDDETVVPEQIFATEHLINRGRRRSIQKAVAPCGHLGLFMGQNILSTAWPEISQWLLHGSKT